MPLSFPVHNSSLRSLHRTIALAVLSFLTLSLPSFGQTTAESDSGSIAVHVLQQGRPVADAEIWRVLPMSYFRDGVNAVSARIGKTGADGTIAVPMRMQNGRVMGAPQLYARGPGSLAGFARVYIFTDPDSMTLPLSPSRTVSGVVRDHRGRPVPDAEITIWHIIGRDRMEYSQIDLHGTVPGSFAKSDSRGRFVLSGIPESSHIGIFAAAPGKAALCVRNIPSGMENLDIRLEPESRITGRVMFENGEPAKGIGVELTRNFSSAWSEGYNYCVSDSGGQYAFEHLSSGMYGIQAYPANPDSTLGDRVALQRENIGVGRGKTAEHMDIKLVRGIPLTGMVVEKNSGEPAPGARVFAKLLLSNPSDPHKEPRRTTLASAWTDAKGMYRLTALPGDFELSASPPEGYRRGMLPQRVTVEPQDSLRQGVTLTVDRGKTIRGVVKLPDGSPAVGAEIMPGPWAVYCNSKGEFALSGLISGKEHRFRALSRKADLEAEFIVSPDSVSAGEIVLHQPEFVSAQGIVLNAQGKPLSGITVNLDHAEGLVSTARQKAAITDSAGWFSVDRLRTGLHYRFSVQNDIASSETFLAGKDTGPFHITLPRADRWLEGTVKDAGGKPIAGMRVDTWGAGRAETTTDSDGRYRLDGFASERVELSFRGVQGDFRFREVTTNQRRDFILPTGRHYLAGRVTDVRGKPVSEASVELVRTEKGGRPDVIQTDTGGRFYLSELGYRDVTLRVSSPGYREQTLRVRTDREDVRFRLEKAGR